MCDLLVARGDDVVGVDNLCTGRRFSLAHLEGRTGFGFVECDVSAGLTVDGPVDRVMHLASPGFPPDYSGWPSRRSRSGARGQSTPGWPPRKELGTSWRRPARYGDPLVHPQTESYWGNVNPVRPSVYDAARRFAEAYTMAQHCEHGLDVRISRTFNA